MSPSSFCLPFTPHYCEHWRCSTMRKRKKIDEAATESRCTHSSMKQTKHRNIRKKSSLNFIQFWKPQWTVIKANNVDTTKVQHERDEPNYCQTELHFTISSTAHISLVMSNDLCITLFPFFFFVIFTISKKKCCVLFYDSKVV